MLVSMRIGDAGAPVPSGRRAPPRYVGRLHVASSHDVSGASCGACEPRGSGPRTTVPPQTGQRSTSRPASASSASIQVITVCAGVGATGPGRREQLTGAGELGVDVARGHHADVPDLHVLLGQHVIDEAGEEVLPRQRDGLAVLGAKGDLARGTSTRRCWRCRRDGCSGPDSEHMLRLAEGRLGVDVPRPGRTLQESIEAVGILEVLEDTGVRRRAEGLEKLVAEDGADRLDREEVARAGIQLVPSFESPPAVTMACTWGCKLSSRVQVCRTSVAPSGALKATLARSPARCASGMEQARRRQRAARTPPAAVARR